MDEEEIPDISPEFKPLLHELIDSQVNNRRQAITAAVYLGLESVHLLWETFPEQENRELWETKAKETFDKIFKFYMRIVDEKNRPEH